MTKDLGITLSRFTSLRGNDPHNWRDRTCLHLAADWVMEVTGKDPIPEIRGRWSTEIGAYRVMKSLGYVSLHDIADDYPQLREVKRSQAKRGSVCLLSHPEGVERDFFGISEGEFVWAQGESGLILLPRSQANVFWEIVDG